MKKQKRSIGEEIRMTPNYACRRIFSDDQEKELVEYIVTCSQMCYGLSTIEIRKLAYDMALVNKIDIPENWGRLQLAGLDWLKSFLKRQPSLSIRQPEACSLSRATSFNRQNVKEFHDNIEDVMKRSPHFADGTRIFNLDETGTTTVQKPKKIVAAKGAKQVSKCTSAERGELVTTCCIVSASGNSLPPVMIFPRKTFKEFMLFGCLPGTLGLATPSGWMNSELFPQVMKHFVKFSHSSKDNPSLLIYDNHESHLSIAALNIAKQNGVHVVTLPPHCSNKLQPLDVSVFQSFKAHYNAAVDSLMLAHPGQPITIYEIARCVKVAHERSMTPQNITSGFRKSGVYPFDRDVFTAADFLTSAVTDRPLPESALSSASTAEWDSPHRPTDVGDSPDTCSHAAANENALCSSERSHAEQILESTSENLPHCSTEDIAMTKHASKSKPFISPKQFRGYPKAGERKTKGQGRRKGKSCIATDTPVKNAIEERKSKSNAKKQLFKKTTPTQSYKVTASDSSDEEQLGDIAYAESEDDMDLDTEAEPTGFEELERDLREGDYVLVKFHQKKNIFFVGIVTGLKDDEGDYEVTFLRKSSKILDKFVYPTVPDICSVNEASIKMILPTPAPHKGTKRQASYYHFEVNFGNMDVR